MHMSLTFVLAVTVGFIVNCQGLKIAVVSFPELGHLNPLLAVAQAAVEGGHSVEIFGPDFFMHTCKRETQGTGISCVDYGGMEGSHIRSDEYFQELVSRPAIETFQQVEDEIVDYNNNTIQKLHASFSESHGKQKIDVAFIDFGQWSAVGVADVLDIPVVMIWPLVLQFPVALDPSVPAIAASMSAHFSGVLRLGNALFQRLSIFTGTLRQNRENSVRRRVGAEDLDVFDYYARRWIVTPSVLGLDNAQPLCPNVVPVGLLARPVADEGMDKDWTEWADSCEKGIIYFNMGSMAVLPDEWATRFISSQEQLVSKGLCVCWKLSKKQMASVSNLLGERDIDRNLVRLSTYLPFSPRHLLAHRNTKVFVTHCGDTSVYESIENRVPLVGIPLFADQPDMCERVDDAGIGIALDKFTFTAESLTSAVTKMMRSTVAEKKLHQLLRVAKISGGAKRAVEVLETAAALGVEDFRCPLYDLPWWQLYDLDIAVTLSLVALVSQRLLLVVWRRFR